jgi:hypothetical protein
MHIRSGRSDSRGEEQIGHNNSNFQGLNLAQSRVRDISSIGRPGFPMDRAECACSRSRQRWTKLEADTRPYHGYPPAWNTGLCSFLLIDLHDPTVQVYVTSSSIFGSSSNGVRRSSRIAHSGAHISCALEPKQAGYPTVVRPGEILYLVCPASMRRIWHAHVLFRILHLVRRLHV